MIKKKRLLAFTLFLVFVLSTSITVFAASTPDLPYNSANTLYIDSTWRKIGSSSSKTTGMDCRIVVCGETQGLMGIDIKMTGASGNYLWSQEDAISSYYPETFYCGSDVYDVGVRTDDPYGGWAWAGYVTGS